MKKTTDHIIKGIRHYLGLGRSMQEIATLLGVSKSTVGKYSRLETSEKETKNLGGRPRKVSLRVESGISKKTSAGALKNSTDIVKYVKDLTNITISNETARKILVKRGFKSYVRCKKPYLSSKHMANRRDFCRRFRDLTIDDWSRVVFTDESKFNLHGNDSNKRVWKKPKSPLLPHHIRTVIKFGGGSVMVWGAITRNGVGKLHLIEGKMDSKVYTEILCSSFFSSLSDNNLNLEDSILMHDNDPKHKSLFTKLWLGRNNVGVLEWPSCSPDLKIIENVWDHLERRIRKYHGKPGNNRELWNILQEEWYKIDNSYILKLYESIPRRIEAVLKSKGAQTKY